jgi:hypothetical protein
MDGSRFDGIARAWHTGSRRRMLGALAAAALTPLLPQRAGAACVEGTIQQFECGVRECIGGEFVTTFDEGNECSPAPSECVGASFCTGGSLACPPNRNLPNGTECGDDGNVCTDNVCQGGQCAAVANTAACTDDGNPCTNDICAGGTCAHPAKQDGTPCPTGVCRSGQCVSPQSGACDPSCAAGLTCCDGVCVNLQKSKRNCGACGKRCRKGKRCRGGRCR